MGDYRQQQREQQQPETDLPITAPVAHNHGQTGLPVAFNVQAVCVYEQLPIQLFHNCRRDDAAGLEKASGMPPCSTEYAEQQRVHQW